MELKNENEIENIYLHKARDKHTFQITHTRRQYVWKRQCLFIVATLRYI